MFTALDMENILWQIVSQAPPATALLVCSLVLFAKRRVAPRACTIAAMVYLGLFLLNVSLLLVNQWLIWQLNNGGTLLSQPDFLLAVRLFHVFRTCLYAIGIAVVTWCVMADRNCPEAE